MEEVYKKAINRYPILILDQNDIQTLYDIMSGERICKSIEIFHTEIETNIKIGIKDILQPIPLIRKRYLRRLKFSTIDELNKYAMGKKTLTNLELIGFDENHKPVISLKLEEDDASLIYGESSYQSVSKIDDLLLNKKSRLNLFTSKWAVLFIASIFLIGITLTGMTFGNSITTNILNSISVLFFFLIGILWFTACYYLNKFEHVEIKFGQAGTSIWSDIIKALVYAIRIGIKFI